MRKVLFGLSLMMVTLLIAGCSKDPQEYLSEAKTLVDAKKYKEAITVYEKMIADLPESDSLQVAYFNLGSLYRTPEIAVTSKDKLKAIEYYRTVFDKFPKSVYAPMALFNVGFIYGTELNDIKNATDNYNILIKNFPNHQLSDIAKQDMQMLGKNIEEDLNKKIKEQEERAKKEGNKKEVAHP
jgi:TolA-binding protein